MKIMITFFLLAGFFLTNGQSEALMDSSGKKIFTADSICLRADVDAKFKKGSWEDFLAKHMIYPKDAQKNEIQGQVIVEYVIEADGSLTNIQALSGPTELRANAEELIRKSPKWIPDLYNGKPVRTSQRQPIEYQLTH